MPNAPVYLVDCGSGCCLSVGDLPQRMVSGRKVAGEARDTPGANERVQAGLDLMCVAARRVEDLTVTEGP